MPQTPHVESHFTASEFVRDIVIGMADGLTVPFALAAGLSGADTTTRIIVIAGLAEIAAGSIAMGLGGYLAAKNDADHYVSELKREQREVEEIPEEEAREVLEVFETYGLTHAEAVPIVDSLRPASEAVDRFHDAIRTGSGRAGSQARRAKRQHHRGRLHRGRPDSAGAVYADGIGLNRPDGFRRRHHPGSRDLWRGQGPLYGYAAGIGRNPHRVHWRAGRGGGVRDRTTGFWGKIEEAVYVPQHRPHAVPRFSNQLLRISNKG